MKIGILTFHWATNYGAVLQAWCLQEFLVTQGHEVEIINYKPYQYDFSWNNIIMNPRKWFSISRLLASKGKESLLVPFRNKYLKTTRRYGAINEFVNEIDKYDVLISGSDQVLNPSFTLFGDNGKTSLAYWLNAGRKDACRIGYAVSFGCESYPDKAASIARSWVNEFDVIGTRENTGLQILDQLAYQGSKNVVPDPTILMGSSIFEKLGVATPEVRLDYTCVYMLRHEIQLPGNTLYLDEKHRPLNMVEWLTTIVSAKQLVTNSYHGMIMAIFAHVPFVVLVETDSGSGMNDRFITLLTQLELQNRITDSCKGINEIFNSNIDWQSVDEHLNSYRNKGVDFLKSAIIPFTVK